MTALPTGSWLTLTSAWFRFVGTQPFLGYPLIAPSGHVCPGLMDLQGGCDVKLLVIRSEGNLGCSSFTCCTSRKAPSSACDWSKWVPESQREFLLLEKPRSEMPIIVKDLLRLESVMNHGN